MRKLGFEDIRSLVASIAYQVQEYGPDVVVAVGMGGWTPARLLKNHVKAEYYSIGCSYYDEHNRKTDAVRITQDLSGVTLQGKRVLILDEVADSGDTLDAVYAYVRGLGPAAVRTAVLHTKSCSHFTPDITAESVGEEWLIYPWEE